jgi:hypothetical protein
MGFISVGKGKRLTRRTGDYSIEFVTRRRKISHVKSKLQFTGANDTKAFLLESAPEQIRAVKHAQN